jgi:phosphoribosylformimino-5-aminoimidazole carboxamide ribotide isomerase
VAQLRDLDRDAAIVSACYYASVSIRKGPGPGPDGRAFDVIPAIDLRAGRVVRLQGGDFARERIYADDPVAVAGGFAAAGAAWLHVVDLDGARAGERRQTTLIAAVRNSLPATVRLQVGGGIRSSRALAETLADGVDRVVLGTAALENPDLIAAAIASHGTDRIAVALDIRQGRALGHGWLTGTAGDVALGGVPVDDALAELESRGVGTFVVTGIDRDGLLGGPDVGLVERVVGRTRARVIASGGIATIDDIRAIQAIGCYGAIIGRALYDGRIDLAEALAAVA